MTAENKESKSFSGSMFGKQISEMIIRDMVDLGKMRTFKKSEFLFHEEDPANAMYAILEGTVKLVRYSPDGRETIVHLAQENMFIAEAALFMGHYPVTAITENDVKALQLSRETVFALMEKHPEFLRLMFDAMAAWLKRMVDKVDELTLHDASARLASYLLRQGDCDEKTNECVTITLPMKKGDLATMLNMKQATLSRALRKLQDDDIIQVNGKKLTLTNIIELRKCLLPPID